MVILLLLFILLFVLVVKSAAARRCEETTPEEDLIDLLERAFPIVIIALFACALFVDIIIVNKSLYIYAFSVNRCVRVRV
jgi:hypothetical protein